GLVENHGRPPGVDYRQDCGSSPLSFRWMSESPITSGAGPARGLPRSEEDSFMPRSCINLAILAFIALALPARAGTLPADALPLPNRVATADIVVAGKVTSIEDKTVMAAQFPGAKNKIEYRIAVVTLSDALLAPKDT